MELKWWRRILGVLVALILAFSLASPADATMPRGPLLQSPRNHETVNHPAFQWARVFGAEEYTIEIAQDRRFASKSFEYSTAASRFTPPRTMPAGSFWWRVRVTEPFRSSWSSKRQFTRRWLTEEPGSSKPEIARPGSVTVEDFSSEPGLQAPMNALQIRWNPVEDASYYVVQMDRVDDADPDLVPPYSSQFEPPDAVCITTHTVLTPNQGPVAVPEQGTSLISDDFAQECTVDAPGRWVMRVRAVDVTVDGVELYSLWSDEARSPDHPAPGPTVFTVGPRLSEDTARGPAVLTSPENAATFTDAPLLSWNPKIIGPPATDLCTWTTSDPCYKIVLALDPDFTTEVGHYYSSNTRFVPLDRIPEGNAERAYYWYVVPCYLEESSGKGYCLSSNQVVNRPSIYRHFVKVSPRLDTHRSLRNAAPFTTFTWATSAHTAVRFGRANDSVGGVNYYEFQTRLPGQQWPDSPDGASDIPEYVPENLAFNTPYQWRVRAVDGSGQTRPWSIPRDVTTMAAAPASPPRLRAQRIKDRLVLTWGSPRSPYYYITDYAIFYSLNGRRWKESGRTGAHTAKFNISKGTKYWFSVIANSRGGSSRPSKVVVGK